MVAQTRLVDCGRVRCLRSESVFISRTGPKRVRAYLGGELIANTKRLKLVWEVPY
jgi:hypothetical protein